MPPPPLRITKDDLRPPAPPRPAIPARPARQDVRGRVAFGCALLVVAAVAIFYGVAIRQAVWQSATTIHQGSVPNPAIEVADRLRQTGVLHAYDGTLSVAHPPPLRLALIDQWARWVARNAPGVATDLAHHTTALAPLLHLNTLCEGVAALAAGLLVFVWVRRSASTPLAFYRPALAGVAAGLLLWFNPAVIWDTHAAARWDVWGLPFLLFAGLAASLEAWFAAGLLLAVGGMLSGQVFFAAPLVLLWAVFAGKPAAAMRFAVGLLSAAAAITCPWLIQHRAGAAWAASVTLAGVCVYPWPWMRRTGLGVRITCVAAAVVLILWPWPRPAEATAVWVAVPAMVVGLAQLRGRSDRRFAVWFAAFAAAGLFFSAYAFGGSFAWLRAAFVDPLRGPHSLSTGHASNLPGLLALRFGRTTGDLLGTVSLSHRAWPLTLQTLLAIVGGVALVVCSAGAALHARRRDARWLAAFAAPWLVLFALLPGMPPQFLLWAAACSAVLAGCGFGMTLLHLLISAMALAMMAHTSLNAATAPKLVRFLDGTHPDIGWVVLLTSLVLVFLAVAPRPRLKRSATRRPRVASTRPVVRAQVLPEPRALPAAPAPSRPAAVPRRGSGFIDPPKILDTAEPRLVPALEGDPSIVRLLRDDF